MFKTIDTSGQIFYLIDSHFNVCIYSCLLKSILDIYLGRNLPIAKNVALYYKWWFRPVNPISHHLGSEKLITDRTHIDHHYPEINYGIKYFPCIINHIKQFNYDHCE